MIRMKNCNIQGDKYKWKNMKNIQFLWHNKQDCISVLFSIDSTVYYEVKKCWVNWFKSIYRTDNKRRNKTWKWNNCWLKSLFAIPKVGKSLWFYVYADKINNAWPHEGQDHTKFLPYEIKIVHPYSFISLWKVIIFLLISVLSSTHTKLNAISNHLPYAIRLLNVVFFCSIIKD